MTKIPAQEKLKATHSVIKFKRPVSKVAHELGVSRKTVYAWIKNYKAASPRLRPRVFEPKYRKGVSHPRAYSYKLRSKLIRNITKNPSLSATALSKSLKVGRHAVVNLLKSLDLSTKSDRMALKRLYSGPGRIASDIKSEIARKINTHEYSVSSVSKKYGVSRKAVYAWLNDFNNKGKITEKYKSGFSHPRAWNEGKEEDILNSIVDTPSFSIHKLAKRIGVSSHGLWNLLKRHNITTIEARINFALARKEAAPGPSTPLRVKSVFESFTPNVAPAPPPNLAEASVEAGPTSLKTLLKIFASSVGLSCILGLGLIFWVSILVTPGVSSVGLIFATIALLIGTFFFIFSFKYYLTIALVLSFSQSGGSESLPNGQKEGFLSWLLGGAKGVSSKGGKRPAVGLEPNLDHIKLSRHPYVSVHIPFYNEKNVVERAIRAATSFDYPEYEVILCDDSVDETTSIIRDYLVNTGNKVTYSEGDNYTLASAEVSPGVTLKHLHRTTRGGFKGGALKLALTLVDPRTEFVSIFDADFVPYPDSLTLFLKYFKAENNMSEKYNESNVAVVQGYQWHVLNKSENWITRGVRSEYSGSYVIERTGTEIYGGLKMISGSVYMIRIDPLKEVGWQTSITEDFELTLRLYDKGYRVVYTPYIQAPAECVSTIKRMVRQRMRWAEGHSFNVKRMFTRLIFGHWEVNSERKWVPSPLTPAEKLEFLYLTPYYLQAFFFLIGTLAWFISETVFPARLPFWTSLWGWSLVLTNLFALPLVNAVGMFLEESEEKDYVGLLSFIALSYIVVPFQAYAAVKGFIEKEEGPWFRTPKTGRITDVFARGTFLRFIQGILSSNSKSPVVAKSVKTQSKYLSLITANNKFNDFNIKPRRAMRFVANVSFVFVLIFSISLGFYAPILSGVVKTAKSVNTKRLSVDKASQIGKDSQDLHLDDGKENYSFNESPEFTLKDESKKKRIIGFGPTEVRAMEKGDIAASLFYRGEEVKDVVPEIIERNDGTFGIKIPQDENLKPGRYVLRTAVIKDDKEIYEAKEDFTWGVLAINTNKSRYRPGETAKLMFSVLDDIGNPICDAYLKLKVTSSNGAERELSNANGLIKRSDLCSSTKVHYDGDYESEYQLIERGTYRLYLTANTSNGSKEIEDKIEVTDDIKFDIERTLFPTRIYPPNNYPVELRVKANSDFTGTVSDETPLNFSIFDISGGGSNEKGVRQKINWNVEWKKGESYSLKYSITFPPDSPAFYQIGKLRIGDFEETRYWQVAGDTSGDIAHDTTVTGNNGSGAATVVSSAITTGGANRLLIATISVDQTVSPDEDVTSVTGGSLTWEQITGVQVGGGANIRTVAWRAFATSTLTSQTITANIGGGVKAAMVVSAYSGTNITGTNGSNAIGAYATSSPSGGNLSINLVTTGTNSLVISTLGGQSAVTVTAGSGQTVNGQDQATTTPSNAQERQNSLTVNKGTTVTSSYTHSTTNGTLIAIELLGQGPGIIQHEATVTGDNSTGASTVATATGLTTSGPNRLLIAAVSTAPAVGVPTQVSSISGASLTWENVIVAQKSVTLERHEIWRAFATSSISSQTITASLSQSSNATIVVTSYVGTNTSGTNGSGAIGITGSLTGASVSPSVSVATRGSNSLVISGLTTSSNPTIAIGTNQTLNGSDVASTSISGAQGRGNYTTVSRGTSVTSNYTLGSSVNWVVASVEILGSDPGIVLDAVTGATASTIYTSGTNLTFSHTVADRPNRLLVVTIARRAGDATSTVTAGGTSMSLGTRQDNGTAEEAEVYYLAGSSTGSVSIVITPSPTGPDFRASASSWYHADQTNTLDINNGGGTGTAGNVSHSVTTTDDNELMVNVITHESTAAPTLPDATQTSINLTDEGVWDTGATYKYAGAEGSFSMGFNNANSDTYAHAISTFRAYTTYNQTAYRWFDNDNAVTVTTAKAANNTTATAPAAGTVFRLRLLIHISNNQLASSGKNFKLQKAQVGTDSVCDANFDGETYTDVGSTGDIKYDTSNSPADNATLTVNGSLDPTHGSDTVVGQTYNEANNFTNSVAVIPQNQDGEWDFALTVDSGAAANTKYCFRATIDDATPTLLDSYTVIPEITTVPENEWILFGALPILYVGIRKILNRKTKK